MRTAEWPPGYHERRLTGRRTQERGQCESCGREHESDLIQEEQAAAVHAVGNRTAQERAGNEGAELARAQ